MLIKPDCRIYRLKSFLLSHTVSFVNGNNIDILPNVYVNLRRVPMESGSLGPALPLYTLEE